MIFDRALLICSLLLLANAVAFKSVLVMSIMTDCVVFTRNVSVTAKVFGSVPNAALQPSSASWCGPSARTYRRAPSDVPIALCGRMPAPAPYTSAGKVMSETSILPLVSGPQSSDATKISAAPTVPTSIGMANPDGCPAANAAITGATRPPQIAP